MKKRIISLCLLVVMSLSTVMLSSCHGNSKPLDEFVAPKTFDESKTYEITFWAKHESNVDQKNVYLAAIESFERLYPNIKVTLKDYTNYNDIFNDVKINIKTKTPPNVCITYPDHIATYLTGTNVVVPLDDLMSNENYGLGGSALKFDSPEKSEIVAKFLEECKINGKYYAMPFMRSTEALYINKDAVEALGFDIPDIITWEYIWQVSEAAMEKNPDGTYKGNGQTKLIPVIYKSTDNMMIQILEQMGADYSTASGEIKLFNDTTKEVLYDLADKVADGLLSTFERDGYPGNWFNRGQCIFAIDSTAGATWMGTDAPHIEIAESELVTFETVVRPVPQVDKDDPKMISQGPSVCIFNKEDTGEVMASWLFVQYLLSNEMQIAYSQTEGYVPVTTKAQNSSEYLDYLSRAGESGSDDKYYDVKIAATKLLIDYVDSSFVTPVFNGSVSLRNAAGELIEEVVKSVKRKETVDAAYMTSLFSRIKSLYKLK